MNASDVVLVREDSDRVTTDRLMADFRMLAADMEHLLKAAGNQTGQHAAQVRVKAEDSLRAAKARVAGTAGRGGREDPSRGTSDRRLRQGQSVAGPGDLHLRGILAGLDAYAEPGIGFLALGAPRIPTHDARVLGSYGSAMRHLCGVAHGTCPKSRPTTNGRRYIRTASGCCSEFLMIGSSECPSGDRTGRVRRNALAPAHTSDAKAIPPSPRENRLLAALPSADYDRLLPSLEPVPLPLGWTIYGPRDTEGTCTSSLPASFPGST